MITGECPRCGASIGGVKVDVRNDDVYFCDECYRERLAADDRSRVVQRASAGGGLLLLFVATPVLLALMVLAVLLTSPAGAITR